MKETTFARNIPLLLLPLLLLPLFSGCSREPAGRADEIAGRPADVRSGTGGALSEQIGGGQTASGPTDNAQSDDAVESFVNETAVTRPESPASAAARTQEEIALWLADNYTDYFQKYALSCEAAVVRLVAAALGVEGLEEDEILDIMPSHPVNPDIGFVVDDLNGGIDNPDGSINWSNYGAHVPVVASTIDRILFERGLSEIYWTRILRLDNPELRTFLEEESGCMAAVIWVAAYVGEDEKPEKNALGQVYGEHVQVVAPVLDENGKMVVYDVWPWEDQPFHLWNPLNRDLFDYQTLLIMTG